MDSAPRDGSSSPPSPLSGDPPSLVAGGNVTFLRFNQDVTSLAVSTSAGYKLFSLASSVDALESVHEKRMEAENAVRKAPRHSRFSWIICSASSLLAFQVLIVERLFSSSLVALVQRSSPRKLRVMKEKLNH